MRTHAAEELLRSSVEASLDIMLRRTVEEIQHPPPPPPWYERMAMELLPVPPLPEGLISAKWSWTGPLPELSEQLQEQPPTPPVRKSVPPAHLWAPQPFIDLGDDDEEE